jgi:hypothetical protein
MQPGTLTGRRIVYLLTTPLLADFLRRAHGSGEFGKRCHQVQAILAYDAGTL